MKGYSVQSESFEYIALMLNTGGHLPTVRVNKILEEASDVQLCLTGNVSCIIKYCIADTVLG